MRCRSIELSELSHGSLGATIEVRCREVESQVGDPSGGRGATPIASPVAQVTVGAVDQLPRGQIGRWCPSGDQRFLGL